MAFDFPDLFEAIRAYAAAHVPGLKQTSYPAPSRIVATPCLIVVSGSDQTAGWDIAHEGPGEQMLTGQAAIQLLVVRVKDAAKEGTLADRMVFPILDAFSVDRDGLGVEFPDLDQHIDRCVVTHYTANASMTYGGGEKYVGVEFVLDIKFHRVWDQE